MISTNQGLSSTFPIPLTRPHTALYLFILLEASHLVESAAIAAAASAAVVYYFVVITLEVCTDGHWDTLRRVHFRSQPTILRIRRRFASICLKVIPPPLPEQRLPCDNAQRSRYRVVVQGSGTSRDSMLKTTIYVPQGYIYICSPHSEARRMDECINCCGWL